MPAGLDAVARAILIGVGATIILDLWGAFAARDPKANAAHVAELFRLWEAGAINPKVSATYPLERAGEAITAMANRQAIGKLVVTV